jgi:hypothetical protein
MEKVYAWRLLLRYRNFDCGYAERGTGAFVVREKDTNFFAGKTSDSEETTRLSVVRRQLDVIDNDRIYRPFALLQSQSQLFLKRSKDRRACWLWCIRTVRLIG